MRLFFAAWLLGVLPLCAQEAPPIPPPEQFMAEYTRVLLAQDREALIRLYSPRGTLFIADGIDEFSPLEQTADIYRRVWGGPTAFSWEQLNYQRLHAEVVAVTGIFKWTSPQYPEGARFNYSGILVFEEGKWHIRSEIEFPFTEWKLMDGASREPGALGATRSTACVFCDIIAGKRQQEGIVYRDDQVVAFLSIGPRNPGHVLIVPVAHAEGFPDVPTDTMHAMTAAAKKIVAAMKHTDLKMEGFVLQMNTGKAAGQSVFHAHLHIIPRFTGEPAAKTPEERVGMDVLAPVAAKIRAALGENIKRPSSEESALGATRSTFELPPINTEVPLDRIKEICAHYGLQALWAKIEKDPPLRPFKSDGCTGWFADWRGVSLYPAGFLHDLKYWAGYPGEDVERLIADAELMTDVARLLKSTTMAETIFHGVRVGGTEQLQASFSWGFGRVK